MYIKNNRLSNQLMSVAINILSTSSRLEHFMSVVLKPFSLTLPQFNALDILASHHPSPIVLKKLTDNMIDKSSNTSRLIDKLSEKKLVTRQLAPEDRRVIHISLTEEGLALVDHVSDTLESNLKKHFLPHEDNVTGQLIENLKILRGV